MFGVNRLYNERTADILRRTLGSFVTSSFGPIRTMGPRYRESGRKFLSISSSTTALTIFLAYLRSVQMKATPQGPQQPGFRPPHKRRAGDVSQAQPRANPGEDGIHDQNREQGPRPCPRKSEGYVREKHVI